MSAVISNASTDTTVQEDFPGGLLQVGLAGAGTVKVFWRESASDQWVEVGGSETTGPSIVANIAKGQIEYRLTGATNAYVYGTPLPRASRV